MRKYTILFLLTVLLAACKEKLPKPSVLIQQDKMEEVLYDLAILYGIHGSGIYYRDSIDQTTVNAIYRKYGIDSLTFIENNNYYINLPEGVYLKMQEAVLKRLEAENQKVDSLILAEPVLLERARKLDSL